MYNFGLRGNPGTCGGHKASSSHIPIIPHQKAYCSFSGKSGARIWVEIPAVHLHLWISDRSTMLHHGPSSFPFRQASKPRACIAPKSTTPPNWTVDPPKSPKAPVFESTQKIVYNNTVCFLHGPLGFTSPSYWCPICHCIALQASLIYSARWFWLLECYLLSSSCSPSSASLTG